MKKTLADKVAIASPTVAGLHHQIIDLFLCDRSNSCGCDQGKGVGFIANGSGQDCSYGCGPLSGAVLRGDSMKSMIRDYPQ